jgi:phosphoglycerate dehydrogenase-like enzyme
MRVALWAQPLSRPFLEARLRRIDGLDLVSARDEAEAVHAVAGAEVLVTGHNMYGGVIEQAAKESAPGLRWIQLLTAGFDKLRRPMIPDGVIVTSAGDGLAPTVAEHALTLLLALGRKLPVTLANQAAGSWDRTIKETLFSLNDRAVAVVGFGPIGRAIAVRLRPFGARVLAVSLHGRSSPLADECHAAGALDAVLARADAAVLALPLTPATRRVFDADRLAACKPGMLLVNVGRGAVVDPAALVAALQSGRIGGAGLDVTDPEPLPTDHPLWSAPNVLITPHCAAGGGYVTLAEFIGRNVEAYMKGEEPLCAVALPA